MDQTDLDNNGDDLVHPKFSTHDEEERDEESFDPRVQTPSHVESTDDEDDNEEVQSVNIEGEEKDEEANSEKSEGNELYRDLNVNLEGRDVKMTDAQPTNVQTTQVQKTLCKNSETCQKDATAKSCLMDKGLTGLSKLLLTEAGHERSKTQISLSLPAAQASKEDILMKVIVSGKRLILTMMMIDVHRDINDDDVHNHIDDDNQMMLIKIIDDQAMRLMMIAQIKMMKKSFDPRVQTPYMLNLCDEDVMKKFQSREYEGDEIDCKARPPKQ
ncbi:hypothetical protein Tco_0331414 [Tanacetum coccineum]